MKTTEIDTGWTTCSGAGNRLPGRPCAICGHMTHNRTAQTDSKPTGDDDLLRIIELCDDAPDGDKRGDAKEMDASLCQIHKIAWQIASHDNLEPDRMVLDLMIRDGDPFVAALAQAWLRADRASGRKLARAFGDLYLAHEKAGPRPDH